MNSKQIVVKTEYELTDLLRRIDETEVKRVLINFSEPSALLISPINLKVIREHADSHGKALIMQIIGNDIAIGNAQKAQNIVVDSLGEVEDSVWQEAEEGLKSRTMENKAHLGEEQWSPAIGEIETEPAMPLTEEQIDESKSEFSRRVDEALEKSSQVIADNQHRVIQEGNVKVALDHDIEEFDAESAGLRSLVGVDFMRNTLTPEDEALAGQDIAIPNESVSGMISARPLDSDNDWKGKLAVFGATLKQFFITKGWLWKLGIPVLLLLGIGAFSYYYFFPSAVVNIYVAGKEVEVAKEFEGRQDVTESNIDEGYVVVKKETISKGFSNSGGVTGKGIRGEKAKGKVRIFNMNPDTVAIPAGTKITTGSGLQFSITTATEADPLVPIDAPVEAVDIGEQYNISAFTSFTMAGYPNVTVTSSGDFTGGSRQEFDSPTQGDIDAVANPLKDRANSEIDSDLRDKAVDGWEIIESSIYREVKEGPSSDKAVGAEAQIINVTMKVDGEALFYKKEEFTDNAKQLLIDEANKNKLFESDTENGLTLELDNKIESNAEAVVEGDKVIVRFNSKGVVRPIVDKEKIIGQLHSLRNWEKGKEYLGSLDFVAKPTEVIYNPSNFPDWLKYFPNRRGAVILNVSYIDPEPASEN